MSILGGAALLLGITVGGAIAITSLTANADTVLVHGQSAAVTDVSGATDIMGVLKNSSQTYITNESFITGETKAIETSSQPLYLGDWMNDTKATFTKDQLPTVLADGSVEDSDGKDYDYNLKINVPNTKIVYGEGPDNLDPPVIYADFSSQDKQYDMRIIFPTAVNTTLLTDETIKLFGKNYVFSGNSDDLKSTQVVLYENSQSIRVDDGGSVTQGGHTYSVSVEDALHTIVVVDGYSRSVKEGYSGKINGVNVYVKDIFGPDYISSGQTRYVELYINSNSITLENNQEVKIGSDDISGTKVTFVNNGGKVSEIKISVSPYELSNDIRYIKEGNNSFVDPVFKSIRFTLQGVTPKLEDSSRDIIDLKATREDKVGITFVNRQGKEYSLDVLKPSNITLDSSYTPMYNSTCTVKGTQIVSVPHTSQVFNSTTNLTDTIVTYTNENQTYCVTPGTWTYNATQLGTGDNQLIVETNKNMVEGDYFVTTSGEYSQIWKVENIKSDGKVDIKDANGGDTITLSIGSVGSSGSLSLADGSSATIKLVDANHVALLDKAANYIYTEKGAKIILPIDNTGTVQLIEETSYNGGDFHANNGNSLGNTLNFTWVYKKDRSGRDMFLKGSSYGTKDSTYWSGTVGDDDVYSVTKYGTFVKQTGTDDKQLEIFYPENAIQSKFFIGELNSQLDSTLVDTSSMIKITDSAIETYKTRNLVVVGGSCINSVAAQLLGSSTPLCGEAFTAKTNVTAGHYLIQAFKNPWNQEKVAILVAGYNAEDTTRAVNDILSKSMNLSVGSKIIG